MKTRHLIAVPLAVAVSLGAAPAAQAEHRRGSPIATPIVGVIPDTSALLLPAIQAAREALGRAGLLLPPNPCLERRACS